MRRLFTSWLALGAVLVVLVVGASLLVQQLQGLVASRAEEGAVETARIVTALVVTRNVAAGASVSSDLTAAQKAEIDADISALFDQGQLVGLEVWRADGRLLYGDRRHPVEEDSLPAAELARVKLGKPWIARVEGERAVPTLVVFLPFDTDGDGSVDGAVEVLVPDSEIAAEIRRSTVELYSLAALMLMVLVALALGLRRRLLAQEHDATHDPLTDLPNRKALHRETERALTDAKTAPGRLSALLVLDLDGFKTVNDTLGHPAGDKLLVQVAGSLQGSLRPNDMIARLGGDEFAILLTQLSDRSRAESVAAQILSRLRTDSFQVQGIDLTVDASIGIAMLPEHGDTVDLLLQRADVAMYQAKRASAGVKTYDEANDPHDVLQLGLLVELRRAVDNDGLVLHYQPKLSLGTGDLRGVEALVRWQHPTRGLLPPMEFLPLAENTGLMQPLTDWVLRHAIAKAAQWRDEGLMIPIAVNIGPRSLLDRDLPAFVLGLLVEAGLPATLLELEITETAIMTDPARAAHVIAHLQAMGVRVAIDDFGVGYTSLAYLKSLPVDTLKIDRHFIAEMMHSQKDQAIVEAVIGLGHRLGFTVLAEGIENKAVVDALRRLHCDEGQGYHLARPMAEDKLDSWITHHLLGSATAPPAA